MLTTIDRHQSLTLPISLESSFSHTLAASAGREEDNPALLAAAARREEEASEKNPQSPVLAAWNGVVEQGRGGLKEETVNPFVLAAHGREQGRGRERPTSLAS